MALTPRLSRLSAAALALLGLVGALACGGKTRSDTVPPAAHGILGTVSYTKVPLHKDANGVPTGLETDTTKFTVKAPAKGILVKAYQRNEVTQPDGSVAAGWVLVGQAVTDALGTYRFRTLLADKDYSIEVVSEGDEQGGLVNLIAEANGLASTLPQAQRSRYRLRQSPDGTAATAANVTPYSKLTADKVLPFTIDATTTWLIGRSDYDPITRTTTTFPNAVLESAPSGNRPLAILDTINTFSQHFGDPTPSGNLDLHYVQGRSEPEGSFIEYDNSRWLQPDGTDYAFDADLGVMHYFGSLQGGSNDDALDEAVIFQVMGRSVLFHRMTSFPFTGSVTQRLPMPPAPQDNLSPELALLEGFPAAMAADLLKSPYLADTNGASLAAPVVDIRDLSGVPAGDVGPLSPRTLGAVAWKLILKANSLPDPGISTDWDKIDPNALSRFFAVQSPFTTTTTGTVTTTALEVPNTFHQVALLKNAQVFGEPVDLAKIFTDAVLTPLLQPFNIPWPQPTTGANSSFINFWGLDPTGAKGPLTLSMSQAQAVNSVFPNLSQGEVKYAYFSLDADTPYDFNVTTSPATLPNGARIEVAFLSPSPTRFSLVSTGSSTTTRFLLTGGTATTPGNQLMRVRLLSPTTQISDVQVTLNFTKALVPKTSR